MSAWTVVTVGPPPRGPGDQPAVTFGAQAMRGSLAWGGSPSTATLTYPELADGLGVAVGAQVHIQIGGVSFDGLCKSDVNATTSRGNMRELQFVDLREFLTWDFVRGTFNNPQRMLVDGVWRRRWWHIYPEHAALNIKTWTDGPLLAFQILRLLMTAPTVGSPWDWDLTGNRVWPLGLMNWPVFGFDCMQGTRLDAALNDLSERGGLVFCLDPLHPYNPLDNPYRLTWARKGYGLVPFGNNGFPVNADERRSGLALSGNATNIMVLGERNRYTILDMPLTPDWNWNWETLLVADALYLDIYKNPTLFGLYYEGMNGHPELDPEGWNQGQAARLMSLTITVRQYAGVRGAQYADYKKFSGRSRMDMPAALYLATMVFRAYRPDVDHIHNAEGDAIPLTSLTISDSQACMVTYDASTGAMYADTTQLVDGNGVALVKGTLFGQDMFALVNPERVTDTFFDAAVSRWTQLGFRIDDSGEGQRFIIFDAPAFTATGILSDPATTNGFRVLSANPTLSPAPAKAALTFEAENFQYWKSTWPNTSRDRVENVSGLYREYVCSYTVPGFTEITYANGATAGQQADIIANNLLLPQYIYAQGGFRLAWDPKYPASNFGAFLSSVVDRVSIEVGPTGTVAMVDFTTERDRDHFIPERDLERRTLANTLFPGQAALRSEAMSVRSFQAGLRGLGGGGRAVFVDFLRGKFDESMVPVRFVQ